MTQADRVREYVRKQYIDPARAEGERRARVPMGDVKLATGATLAAILNALITRMFRDQARTTTTVCHVGFGMERVLTFELSDD